MAQPVKTKFPVAPPPSQQALHHPPSSIPPLEPGDHLTRAEFERRYATMPNLKKAELIEGIVYMPSPVRMTHSRCHGHIMGWLYAYVAATPGVDLGDNATVRLDADNEPQPDALLRLEPAQGGQSHISEDDYVEGAPELIVEIAGSSAAYDLHTKLHVYRRNGVQEYIVWQIHEQRIDWFILHEGRYHSLPPDEGGVIRSQRFPGLWLDLPAMLQGDRPRVLATLQQGLATDDHLAFVAYLTPPPQPPSETGV